MSAPYFRLWHTKPTFNGELFPSIEEMAKAYFAFEYNLEDDALEEAVLTFLQALAQRMTPQMKHGVYISDSKWFEVWFEGEYIGSYHDDYETASNVMKRMEDSQ